VVLRGFRVFRLLKLAKSWESLNNLIWTVIYALRDIANLALIFFIWAFCSTMLASSIFADKIKFNEKGEVDLENGESPRHNFDTMGSAFTSIFIVVQGENWQYVMYDAMRATSPAAGILFVVLAIFGQIILVNLVTAVLIDSFNRRLSE